MTCEVGCVAYETNDTLVLIDPLVRDDHDALATSKDRVTILQTVKFDVRSRPQLTARYQASAEVPVGVEPIEIAGAGGTMYWIPEHNTVVPGDRIIGDRPPGPRLCPESWLRQLDGYMQDDPRERLRPLLDLPVAVVLVSHGEPVLRDGHAALERAALA